jgi:hypothetical protein
VPALGAAHADFVLEIARCDAKADPGWHLTVALSLSRGPGLCPDPTFRADPLTEAAGRLSLLPFRTPWIPFAGKPVLEAEEIRTDADQNVKELLDVIVPDCRRGGLNAALEWVIQPQSGGTAVSVNKPFSYRLRLLMWSE